MSCVEEPVSLAGGILGPQRHVCAFFDTRDQEYRTLLPFVKEGLERGEKAIHIVDPALRADHLARLHAAGVDVGAAQGRRQLEVLDWRQTYLRGGSFDRRAMTALVDDLQRGARAQGFARARLMGHGEWALQADCDGAALVEYEAWVNDGLGQYDDPVVCIYDRNRFAGATAIDVLRAHPTVILDGALRENPSFLAPTRLLSKLHGGGVSVLRDRYVAALVAGAHREALDLLMEDALWQDVPVPSLYLDVIQAAQYEVGRLWQEKRMTVAEEHLATEVARRAIGQLRAHLPCEPSNGRQVVVACVAGELHDLGARMVADFLEMAGCTVHFLGADVSPESLAELVRARPPHLLALSATAASHLPALRETVAAVRGVAGNRVPIAAGGQVFLRKPGLARRLRVDLHAPDARAMVGVVRRFFDAKEGP